MSRWPQRTTEERFFEKVLCDVATQCWVWQGSANDGYGSFRIDATSGGKAHNTSYRMFVGPIPYDWDVHHKCVNTRCVNPAHLVAVSTKEHIADLTPTSVGFINKRKTHCPAGHPLTEGNLDLSTLRGGSRKCLTCKQKRMRESHQRHREERNARRRKKRAAA